MKTKDVPAIIMLLAGGVYCLFGIRYQIPLMDFTVQLLIVLLIFWILGGIIKSVLDHFMGEIEVKTEEEENEEENEKSDDEDSEEDAESEENVETEENQSSEEEE